MDKASADLLAEKLPHVPGNNNSNNPNQGGSGNNHQGIKSFNEMVDKIVKDAFAQDKEAKEAKKLATEMPRPPRGLPQLIKVTESKVSTLTPPSSQGATPPPLVRNTQDDGYESDSGSGYSSDDFRTTITNFSDTINLNSLFSINPVDDKAGVSPSPSPRSPSTQARSILHNSGPATITPSYPTPARLEPEITPADYISKTPKTPFPHSQPTVQAGIGFFNEKNHKAKGNEGLVTAMAELIEIRASGQKALARIEEKRREALRARLMQKSIRENGRRRTADTNGTGR
jgi:hypothetical protein